MICSFQKNRFWNSKRYTKRTGKTITYEEASEGAYNLGRYAELLYEIAIKELRRKRKLKQFPGGFVHGGPYTCCICHNSQADSWNMWWDLLGFKCIPCQNAIEKGLVPKYVCKHRHSFYEMYELKDIFGIHTMTAKKMIREGKLKARIILNDNGTPYQYLFLKSENEKLRQYESAHTKLNYLCKCDDPSCIRCFGIFCMDEECKIHLPENKIKRRKENIERLKAEMAETEKRIQDPRLEVVKKSNENELKRLGYQIAFLEKSIGSLEKLSV